MESVSETVLSARNLWKARKAIDFRKELITITLREALASMSQPLFEKLRGR